MNNNHVDLSEEDLNDVEIIEPEDLEQEDVTEYMGRTESVRSRVISVLTTVLQTNLVWYVAGLVDGLILLKLFGG